MSQSSEEQTSPMATALSAVREILSPHRPSPAASLTQCAAASPVDYTRSARGGLTTDVTSAVSFLLFERNIPSEIIYRSYLKFKLQRLLNKIMSITSVDYYGVECLIYQSKLIYVNYSLPQSFFTYSIETISFLNLQFIVSHSYIFLLMSAILFQYIIILII